VRLPTSAAGGSTSVRAASGPATVTRPSPSSGRRPRISVPRECGGSTHREYFGNPIPSEGTTWKTPVGLDQCPACRTAGDIVSDEPGECLAERSAAVFNDGTRLGAREASRT